MQYKPQQRHTVTVKFISLNKEAYFLLEESKMNTLQLYKKIKNNSILSYFLKFPEDESLNFIYWFSKQINRKSLPEPLSIDEQTLLSNGDYIICSLFQKVGIERRQLLEQTIDERESENQNLNLIQKVYEKNAIKEESEDVEEELDD